MRPETVIYGGDWSEVVTELNVKWRRHVVGKLTANKRERPKTLAATQNASRKSSGYKNEDVRKHNLRGKYMR